MPVSSNQKRERSPVSDGQSKGKKPRYDTPLERYYTLDEAKRELHKTIEREPGRRIYQVEEWNYNFSKIYQPFVVANREELCDQFILDGETHANVKEYYPGDERCPLVFDIEWYYFTPTPLSELEEHIGHFVDILVAFLSVALERDDKVHITRDDVCVEQACDMEKRKASFHVKVPRLVFRNMAHDMKSFVFYFCAWMGENIEDVSEKIPLIFFYQTPEAQAKIRNYRDEDPDEFWKEIKEMCEAAWLKRPHTRHESCGVDFAIYKNGGTFRLAGATKLKEPGVLPRFLRPCLVTGWWMIRLALKYIDEATLRTTIIPPAEYRRAWACASLLMDPAPSKVNIRQVPPPLGAPWKEPVGDGRYNLLPRPIRADDGEEEERVWTWVLSTRRYVYREQQAHQQTHHSGTRDPTATGAALVDMDIEGDAGEDGFIYLLDDGKVRLYERRDGVWYNRTDDMMCEDIG